MEKCVFVFVISALVLVSVANNNIRNDCGFCGDLPWICDDSTHTLTISGEGKMDCVEKTAPWDAVITSIERIVIKDGVTSIDNNAFRGCSFLKFVVIPHSVTLIGEYAFSGCKRLPSLTIPEGVTTIRTHAFDSCESLTSLSIPASVSSIDYYAFTKCRGLTEFHINSSNAQYSSYDGILFDKNKTTLIAFPAGKTDFYTVPSSINSISSNAFNSCRFTSIIISSNVRSIGDNAFSECENLKRIVLPENITSIESRTFYGCTSLESIIVPSSVISIGQSAFGGCSNLSGVFYLGLSDPASSDSDVFSDCKSLNTVFVSESYNSPTFCGMSISRNCTMVFNYCYETVVENNHCVVQKRKETGYHCIESDEQAVGKCICKTVMPDKEKKWAVEIDIETTEILFTSVPAEDLVFELSSLSGVDEDHIWIEIGFDENGIIKLIVVNVEDEDSARKIENAVDQCKNKN